MTCNSYVNDVVMQNIWFSRTFWFTSWTQVSQFIKFFLKWVCSYLASCNKNELFCCVVVVFNIPHEKHSEISKYLLITEHYLTYVAPSRNFTPIHNIFTQKFQASNSRNLKFHEHLCIKTTISKLSQVDGLPSINSVLTCPFTFIRYWLKLRTEQT